MSPSPIRLTHLDHAGAAYMVDVTAKQPTVRTASASAFVSCSPAIVAALRDGTVPRGTYCRRQGLRHRRGEEGP